MPGRPVRPIGHDGIPKLTVFGVETCEDTAITRDRLRALNVPYVWVDLDHDDGADAYLRGLQGGRRVTPTMVVGAEAEIAEEPGLATVDRLSAAAWPGVPIDLPALSRLHGDPVTRAIPHPRLPAVPRQDGSAAPEFSLAALRNRRQVALLLTHGGECLACLGYVKQVLAETAELLESNSVPVIIGRGEAAGLAGWRHDLPEAAILVADADGRYTSQVLDGLVAAPGAPGSTICFVAGGVALLLLDRWGAPRALLAGEDAGDLIAPPAISSWLAYLEAECSTGGGGWGTRQDWDDDA